MLEANDAISIVREGDLLPEDVVLLRDAQALAARVEALLERTLDRPSAPCGFRVRLARAHALGLLDQLAELVGPPASASPPRAYCVPETPDSGVVMK